jgi:alkanesulfonate monooxygenase SsuD/methylene tetrahydromethanopterin reductase-like flavin-dependent oxidoreductase (luciferase family)
VATHAQIWNAYGTPAELSDHDEVLQAHCEDVGRNHTEIERSVQAKVVIRDTQEEAEAAFAGLLSMNKTLWSGRGVGAKPDMVKRHVFPDPDSAIWLGSPEQISELIAEYVSVGFGTVIAEIPAPYDRETIERLIGEVAPLVHAGGVP